MKDTPIPDLPSPSPPVADRRPGSGIMRTKELSLPLTSYRTRRAGAAPHLGSTVELALDTEVAGKPAPGACMWKSWPCLLSAGQRVAWTRKRHPPPLLHLLPAMGKQERQPQGRENERIGHVPHRLQHSGEQACTSPGQQVRAGPLCRGWW